MEVGATAANRTDIAPGVSMTLSRLPRLEPNLDVAQLVRSNYKDRSLTFQATIQTTADALTIVVAMPSGPPLVSIIWKDGRITGTQAPSLPPSLTPDHLLADIMSLYAPAEALNAALAGAEVVDAGTARTIEKPDGTVVVRITRPGDDPWSGPATLHNLAFGYQLGINSRRVNP